ncbi:hypothetical protein REPUB_Repub12eG0157700 [Reevesia pubescens]
MNIPLEIGFRFLPPDEEIINYFLWNKMKGYHDRTHRIKEVDLLKQEPWDLPALSIVKSRYQEWFFFYKLNRTSQGKNDRATKAGFWKSTGQDRVISYGGRVIGSKKTLVFHKGRIPRVVKTDWVMHEYRATADFIPPNAESSYVVGCLRNKTAENIGGSTSNNGQPSNQFAASSSQNNAVWAASMEVAPQLHPNNMDYEIAFQTQFEDQGIFDYDLSGLLNIPSSSGVTTNDQNRMEEEGISLEDLLLSNGLVDDEQNEWQLQFDTIDEERDFMVSMFPDQDDRSYEETRYRLCPPDYAESDGTGHGHLEGFNQKRMENGFRHDEIHYMNSCVDSATFTAYEINCLELVGEEKSVNSRASKSQYEPRSHQSVVQGHPKRVQLQGKPSGKAVSREKTRESGVRGPVVELFQNKKSIVQSTKDPKMDQDRNTKSDLNSRSNGSAVSVSDEMSSYSCNDIVGYRFHPTDKELIHNYLWNKALDRDSTVQAICEVVDDLCDWKPEELSINESRTIKLGYWKLTGKPRSIKAKVGIGTKKTLVFYEGSVPKGKWTPWSYTSTLCLILFLTNYVLEGFFLCKLKGKDDEKSVISSGEEGQPINDADGTVFQMHEIQNQSSTNEQDDEYFVSSTLQPQMHEIQNQSSTNEQDDEIQNQSSTNEQDDEYLVLLHYNFRCMRFKINLAPMNKMMSFGKIFSYDDA